ncbi:hypothetical protein LPUS_10933 [Lasallia pustulata]|uniref:Fungal N-terminal domain-containing protein n=1 Tax=Lasallia pustulata TaxID=136370 RepID=A0A1W5DAT5_9LECA|nr:hypothetical protein LPUS_10933 [Lasallia pustulata]
MDPVTVFALVGLVIKGLKEIRIKYEETSRTLAAIETQCKIFETGVSFIQEWLKDTAGQHYSADVHQQRDSLTRALVLIHESMMSLQKDITKVLGAGDGSDGIAVRWMAASKHMWNEDVMKAHLADIRDQATVVQFALSVLQWRTSDSSNPALRKASVDYVKANQPVYSSSLTNRGQFDDPYSISNGTTFIQPIFSSPTNVQEQFSDPYSVLTNPYIISIDPNTVSNDSYKVPHDSHGGSGDPYSISNDPYQVPSNLFPASDDPYSVSNDPYDVMNAGTDMGLFRSSSTDNLDAPPYQGSADGPVSQDKTTNDYSEQSRQAINSASTSDAKEIPGQVGYGSFPIPTAEDISDGLPNPSAPPAAKKKWKRPFGSLGSVVSFSSSSRVRPHKGSKPTVAEESGSATVSSESMPTAGNVGVAEEIFEEE